MLGREVGVRMRQSFSLMLVTKITVLSSYIVFPICSPSCSLEVVMSNQELEPAKDGTHSKPALMREYIPELVQLIVEK